MCLNRTECSMVRVDQRLAEIDCADHDLIIFVCSHFLSPACLLSLFLSKSFLTHSVEQTVTLFFSFVFWL